MFLKIFIVLLQGVFNIEGSGTYCVSTQPKTWKDANGTNTFATPNIRYNEQTLSINISLELENEEVWIGYFKALTAFEYFGCMEENSSRSSNRIKLKNNGPGLCFSACGKQVLVGLGGEMCYCIENTPIVNHHLPNCDKSCEADEEFLCGGAGHISLYKVNKEATMSKQIMERETKEYKCLQLDNNNRSHEKIWKSCGWSFKSMCTFENGTILTDGHSSGWKDVTQKCFQLNGYATRYINTTFDFEELPRGTSWTGVIRSSVIYKYDEMDSRQFKNFDCGYTNDLKELLFTDDCSVVHHFLCHNENNSTMTTSSTYQTASEFTEVISTTKKEVTPSSAIDTASLTEIVTSSTDISAGTKPAASRGKEEDSGDSDVGAVIGATVVSVLVVTAVVVVIVILKRRKKLPFLCKEAVPAKEFGYQQPKRKVDEISRENHDYDHADFDSTNTVNISSNSNYAHTYFVLEPHVNESNTDNTTYDTSGNANKTITEPDNVYNRLKTDNNQTYDHAHTKIRNGVLKFDDTYDTTDKAAMKLKARPGKDSDAFGETDEDAYNHITSKTVTNSKTENEYGVPNTLENAYGDVGANNKNNTHDEGDTYSHINNKPQNKGKQGNPFSESKQMRISKLSEGNQDEDYAVTDGDDKLLTTDNDYSTIGTVH